MGTERKIRRYTGEPTKPIPPPKHTGGMTITSGLIDPAYLMEIGRLATQWPIVEETMIWFLGLLLVADPTPTYTNRLHAKQIFRSLVTPRARIDLMRDLLERAEINKDKPGSFDIVLSEFESLNKLRNDYLHKRWTTSVSASGEMTVTLSNTSPDDFDLYDYREIPLKEIQIANERMDELRKAILELVPAISLGGPP